MLVRKLKIGKYYHYSRVKCTGLHMYDPHKQVNCRIKSMQIRDGIVYNLDDKLHLNVTFLAFKLSYPLLCYGRDTNYAIEYFKLKQINSSYMLCGVYPSHSRFITSSKINITLVMYRLLRSKIVILFEVMDASKFVKFDIRNAFQISNYSESSTSEHDRYCSHTQLLQRMPRQRTFTHQSIRLLTAKMKKLIIQKFSALYYYIFDGPGFNTKIFIPSHKNMKFQTSSFQATLLFGYELIINMSDWYSLVDMVNYSSVPALHNVISIHGENRPKLFKWPGNGCKHNATLHCVINVKIPKTLTINFTVQEIKYFGPMIVNNSCIYVGMSIYFETKKGHLDEFVFKCEDVHFTKYLEDTDIMAMPSLFTLPGTNALWIVIYSYEFYSEITASGWLSLTSCQSVLPPDHTINKGAMYNIMFNQHSIFVNVTQTIYRETQIISHLLSSHLAT